MTVIAVAADEELRGPFLVARSIMASPEAVAAATGGPAHEPLARCLAAMSGEDDPGLANLPADQRLLRTFDLGAVAFRALAGQQGLAVLIDDVQWADDDSLRLLRYVVRANATNPILLLFAIRPEEFALVTEAVNLIADMDRMGVVRRLRVNRFTPAETRSFLAETLDGPIDTNSASVMHGQAEGVPFMVKEMALAYRDSGHDPADRRHVDVGAQRRPPGAVGREDADLPPRRPPARRHEDAAGRGGGARAALQPEGPARDRTAGARGGRRPRCAERDARACGRRRPA